MVDGGLGDAHDSSTWLSAATRREQITSVRIEPDAVLSSQLQLGCRIAVAELGVIIKVPLISPARQTKATCPCFHPPQDARASGTCARMVDIVQAEGLGYKSVRRRCMALERQCFSASEAMDIERESGHPGAVLLCATERGGGDEELAGYLLLHRAAPATVAKLAVAPRYRRQGVGRALIEAALDVFRKTLHDECVLQVDEANAAAQRLYESVGFRVCRRREHYYCKRRSGECESGVGCRHALEMRLSFTPSRLGLSGATTPANSTGDSSHRRNP